MRKPDAMKKIRQRRRDTYEAWLQDIKKIPSNYPTLTEKQWIEAVKYFSGCALCESEEVSTRYYFVPLKNGGRYCDWNIIPVCEKCALKTIINHNYFAKEPRPAGLQKIVKYLEERINAAITKSTEATQQYNDNVAGS